MTTLERHQNAKGEPLYVMAVRLGLSVPMVYKMIGRDYSRDRRVGEFSISYPVLRLVADDTGISTDTLFDEAKAASLAAHNNDA